MDKEKSYILNEVKAIERECHIKGISPQEWVARYAKSYRRKYDNDRLHRDKIG